MLLLFCAVVSIASVERGFNFLGPIIGEFLGPEETLQLAWANFIEKNEHANQKTLRLVNLTATASVGEAISQFYFVNEKPLHILLDKYHGDILSPCIQATSQTCAVVLAIQDLLDSYLDKLENACMFKYLPVSLQRDYDALFSAEGFEIVNNDTEWKKRLRLRQGVNVASVLKLDPTSNTIPVAARKLELPHLHRILIADSQATHRPIAAIFMDSRENCAVKTHVDLFILPASRTAANFVNGSTLLATQGAMRTWMKLISFRNCQFCGLDFFMRDKLNGGFLFGIRSNPLQRLNIFNSMYPETPIVAGLYASLRFGVYDGYLYRHHRNPLRLDIPEPRSPDRVFEPRSIPFDMKMMVRQDLGGPIFFSIEVAGHVLGTSLLSTLDLDYFDIRENLIPLINSDSTSPHVVILDVSDWKIGFWFREFCKKMYRPWLQGFSAAKEFFANLAAVCRSPGNLDLIFSVFGADLEISSVAEIFRKYNELLGIRQKIGK